jgi:hypothetical protein
MGFSRTIESLGNLSAGCAKHRSQCYKGASSTEDAISVNAKTARSKTADRRRNLSRISNLALMSLTLLVLQVASVRASDEKTLARILADAFIADQVVFMCTLEDGSFAKKTAGLLGTSRDYVEHIREEVLSGIPALEATRIIVGAADITRTVGRSQARKFSPNYPDIPAPALRKWCETDGTGIVRALMAKHDQDHEKFLRVHPGSFCILTKPSHHQPDGGPSQERESIPVEALPVFG